MASDVVIAVLVNLGIGLVLLLALWPSPARATRLLQRWGVPDPDERGQAEALRYLKRRRFVYPWLYVGTSVVLNLADRPAGDMTPSILTCLVVGAVLAELIAQRPPRGVRRQAVLTERGVRDLLSPWSVCTWVVLAVAGVGVPALALAGVAPVPVSAPGPLLALAAGAAAAGAVIVGLAVRRPPVLLDRIDEALRLRSARVGLGLSMASLGATASAWNGTQMANLAGVLLGLLGLVGWIATTARVRTTEVAASP